MAKRTKTIAKQLVKFALRKKAEDIVLLDLRKITSMTDYFIVCTGASDVQVKAIADAITDGCKKDKLDVYHVEGYHAARWVLIDLVDIVVHVFHPEVRQYYQLERLWGDAIQETFSEESEDTQN
ncbi:MAG: ribosome silencing factor [Candidatus Latescibacterota bacterium]